MKFTKLALALVFLASASMRALGDSGVDSGGLDCRVRTEAMTVLTDVIFIRPLGVGATLAGAALYVGLSPLTTLASIPAPHDSFQKVGNLLVGTPYGYTFVRPLGEFAATCH